MLSPKQWIVVGSLVLVAIIAYDVTNKSSHKEGSDMAVSHAGETSDTSSWKTFHPQNGRFEILFPSLPQHVAENHPMGVDYTKYDVYLAQERDGTVFLVSMTQYPPSYDTGNGEELLDGVMKGALNANVKNKLLHSEKSTFYNLPALEFVIQNGDFSTKGKAILSEKTLFVLTVMARDSTRLTHDFSTFANSFAIKGGMASQVQENGKEPAPTAESTSKLK